MATPVIGILPGSAVSRDSSLRWLEHGSRVARVRLVFARLAAVALASVALTGTARAHPLGNDSVTHFSVLRLHRDRIELDLLLDLAENPSQAALGSEMDLDGDGLDSPQEQNAWIDRKAAELAGELYLTVEDQRWPFEPVAPSPLPGGRPTTTRFIMKLPGVANMPTYRLMIRYTARPAEPPGPGTYRLVYEDRTYPRQPGLSRILLDRPGEVEVLDPRPPFWSEGENPFLYEQYDPANLPQERRVEFLFRIDPPNLAPAPAPSVKTEAPETTAATMPDDAPALPQWPPYLDSFTDPRNDPARTSLYQAQARQLFELMSGGLGLWTLVLVTVMAFTWGAAHALMPGHAKTVVAAYLVSRHGTYVHAVVLAVVVTLTHTLLVVILGLCVVFLQGSYPAAGPTLHLWLGLLAGALVAAMGLRLAWQALTGRGGHHHHHHHDHPHEHHGHTHEHHHAHPCEHHHAGHRGDPGHALREHAHPHGVPESSCEKPSPSADRLTMRTICALGIAGGIVPCPTATILILLGIGANMVLQALYAVAVFSLGLATALMAVGLLALTSRRYAGRLLRSGERADAHAGNWWLDRLLPGVSGLAVTVLGLLIACNYGFRMAAGRPLLAWLG